MSDRGCIFAGRRGRLPRWTLLLAAMVCTSWVTKARAQYYEYVEEEESEFQMFTLDVTGGELFVEGRHRRDSETRNGRPVKEVDTTLQEGLELNLAGQVYHKALVDWIADVQLGGTQNFLQLDSGDRDSTGTLLGYNLLGFVLKDKPVSARIFARQSNHFIDRSFAQGIEQDSGAQGIEIQARGDWPARFRYEHTTTHEDSEARIDDLESHLLHFNLKDGRDPDWLTELTLERETVDKTTTFLSGSGVEQEYPDQRYELSANNDWRFNMGDTPARLSGLFRVLDRKGFFNNEVLSLGQSLELTHSDTLTSNYSASGSINKTDSQEVRELLGSVGVTKDIYDSLVINASVDARDTQYLDGKESSYGGRLNLDYTKQTPIGVYSSGLTLSRHYESEQSDGGVRRINNRNITLSGTTFVSLPNTNIVAGTIIVTDQTGSLYTENVDYELQTLGATTQIRRLIGGSIGDPETVLVSYNVAVALDVQYTADDIEWTHRIQFEDVPLEIYFTFRRFIEEAYSGEDPGNLDESQSWLAGMEWQLDPITIVLEHEQRDETLTLSSTIDRARVNAAWRVSRDTIVAAGGHYQYLKYDLDSTSTESDYVETYSVYANATTKPRPNLLLRAYGDYSNARGRQTEMRARIGGAMQWSYAKLELSLDGYYSIYEQEQSDGDSIYLGFKLRRTF